MNFDNSPLYYIESNIQGKRYSLYDVAKWKNGLAFRNIDFSETGKPIIKIAELNNGISAGTAFSDKEYSDEVYLTRGDLVFSWSGNPQTSIDIFWYDLPDGWLNQHIFKVTPHEDIIDKNYLYYLMKWLKPNLTAIATNKQTTGLGHVTIADLKRISVVLPSINEQQRLVSLVKAIDDKIVVNRRINDNLQQQARALYQDWFVDFAPFGRIKPIDWKIGKLKDVLRLKRDAIKAGDKPLLPYLPIDVIPMNTFAVTDFKSNDEAQSSLITFDKDDIVIGAMRVYFHRVILAPCEGITRTTCFTLKPFDSAFLSFALLCCDQDSSIEYAQTTSKGSTMPYAVWDGGLGDMEIVIPTRELALKFNELVLPMLRQIQSSYFENLNLRTMRDTLLPKLMSGEIDVSEVEI